MKSQLSFPIAIIKERDPGIYICSENDFGLVSKGGEKFYNDGAIYDCKGDKHHIVKVGLIKRAPIMTSIRYFQAMYVVEIITQMDGHIKLLDFQKIVISHMEKHSKYFLSMGPVDDLKNRILTSNNYIEIISLFK